jgi:DNA-binding GntR family transcriptional regulator
MFQSPPSLRESVYEHIKHRIVRNLIRPGEILYVDRLATELGVSRTPVREALLLLEGDRLVERSPNHGFSVTSIHAQDIKNVYQVRSLLESAASYHAAHLLPEAQLAQLCALFDEATLRMQQGSYELYLSCDLELHQLILAYCGNPLLAQMAQSLSERSLRIRYFADTVPAEHAEIIMTEHLAILDALRERHAERAQEAMRVHLANACQRTLDQLDTRYIDRLRT